MHKRACFGKAYCNEHVKDSQKILQYAENNFYPTFSSSSAKLNFEKVIFNQI